MAASFEAPKRNDRDKAQARLTRDRNAARTAISSGDTDKLRELLGPHGKNLDGGSNFLTVGRAYTSSLAVYAALRGKKEMLVALDAGGVSLKDHKTGCGLPLASAVISGSAETVAWLLPRSGKLGSPSNQDSRARELLELAAWEGREEVFWALCDGLEPLKPRVRGELLAQAANQKAWTLIFQALSKPEWVEVLRIGGSL